MARMFVFISLVLLLLLNVNCVSAATVHGDIYDMDFDLAVDAVVTVNSVPEQTYVAKDGSYLFILAPGDYVIDVMYKSDYMKYSARQNVTIVTDGSYVLDMIMFPDMSEEEDLLNEDIDFSDVYVDEEEDDSYLMYAVVGAASCFIVFFALRYKMGGRKRVSVEREDSADDVIDFIKKNDGRVTQKDIRRQFPVSEAKISLILTELEDRKIIRKIKRGKGNVIVLLGKKG